MAKPVTFLVEFIRGAPLLEELWFIFYVRPALANELIALFKEPPLLSAITALALMNQAKLVSNSRSRYIEPMTLVGVFFLAIGPLSVICLRWLECRFGRLAK